MKCGQTKRGRAGRVGYTLVELGVGIALVTLVVSALYAGMTFTLQISNQTRENLRATQILVEKLEALRLYTWDQIASPFDPDEPEDPLDPFDPEDPHSPEVEADPFILPSTFTAPYTPGSTNAGELTYYGTLTLTNAPVAEAYGPHLLLVKVGVTWTNASGRVQSREMQTLFAKYGMQNNIRR
jgi:type II secretory pathway pseudopilin PulG